MAKPVPVPQRVARICVTKFNDLNGNGKQDPDEPTLTGWVFTVRDSSGNVVGQIKAGGCLEVKPGTYTVEEHVQSGWTPTTPNPQKVTVSPGQMVNLAFGNKGRLQCCQFGLRLYNSLSNTIKKVVVVPTGVPHAVIGVYNDEEPDWQLTRIAGLPYDQYIIEPTDSLAFVPADPSQLLDLDFAIKVDPTNSPTTVRVRWLDALGQVLKEEEVKLECVHDPKLGEEDFQYDWFSKRSTINGLSDKELFSGAEPEECEDFEQEERASACDIIYHCKCDPTTNQDMLELTTSYGQASYYNWQVWDNGTPNPYSGTTASTVSHNLTEGPHRIQVMLTLTYPDPNDPSQDIQDQCQRTIDICIPTANFSWTAAPFCLSGKLLGYTVTFTPQDTRIGSNSYCNISPTSTSLWDFGDTKTQSFTGPPPGTITHEYPPPPAGVDKQYTVKLTVIDICGCTHTKTQVVTISSKCNPVFRIEFELCPLPSPNPPVSVYVKFINDSQKFCNTNFYWDFGDLTPITPNNSGEVWHLYNVPAGQIPVTYTATLTMIDLDVCPGTFLDGHLSGGASESITFQLKPVDLNVTVVVCPDGETTFDAIGTGKVKWSFSGGGLGCQTKVDWANLMQEWHFTCDLADGTYSVGVEAEQPQQPNNSVLVKCSKLIEQFTVTRTCCEDFWIKDHRTKTVNNKDYRMKFKHKVSDPTFGSGTRIVGKTKFKVKQKIGSLSYYRGLNANTVRVLVTDNLRGPGPYQTVTCETCITPTLVNGGNTGYWSSHAKYKTWPTTALGIHKDDPLTSVHYVMHRSGWQWTITVEKPQGLMCCHHCTDVKITES
jgi:hypothetical protein